MSPNVGNFVHDLVEMAKAMETLPQVQAELDRANTQIESYAKQVQDREIAIIGYKEEIETLHAKVRSLEVERDDASFRVLEAEDREHVALNMARSIASAVGNVINTLDPPKPEPVKEPEPIIDHAAEKLAAEPFPPQAQPVATPAEASSNIAFNSPEASKELGKYFQDQPIPDTVYSIQDTTTGQSESSPTDGSTQNVSSGEQKSEQTSVTSSANEGVTSAEPSHGPYFGKRYRDVSGYVNIHDWIGGGGTEADYYSARSPY